jgi:selenocysteine lyase/cysteine desulfurase
MCRDSPWQKEQIMIDPIAEFPVTGKLIHLNHAAVGPWPRVTADAVKAFADENLLRGSLAYGEWIETAQRLREQLCVLLNAASVSEIAFVKNTSEGLSLVAAGIDWRDGDNVVGIRQEFPSNRFPWLALQQSGVEFRQLDLLCCEEDPEAALIALCDEKTRLVTVSAVQYATGFRMDLERLGHHCRANGILFCVDAIQQAGALPLDLRRVKADFATADGHKWLLAPEGLGFFYIREELLEQLRLTRYGWHMAQQMSDYEAEDFSPASTARRFECGSPNMLGIHALSASVGLLLEQGMDAVWESLSERTECLRCGLESMPGIGILSDASDGRRSGILTFSLTRLDNSGLFAHLQDAGVLCAQRGGGIRMSPHFYTPMAQIERTLLLIDDWLSTNAARNP